MTIEKDSKILSKLEEWEKNKECDPKFLEFYQKLLGIQSGAEQLFGTPALALGKKTADSRIEQGLPLVSFDELTFDWALLQGVFSEIAAVFVGYPELFDPIPESFKQSKVEDFLTREVVKAWFEGSTLPVTVVGDDSNEHLLKSIIHATLGPFLSSYARALRAYVKPEHWRRRYCPICGGRPDFAYLDKESGARWLLCSRCDTEWLFQRLECPHCGSRDQNALAYFTDNEGSYRLYVCDDCKRYLKAIDLRRAESEVLLPLERLLTLDIDAQARERGYSPCGEDSAWLEKDKEA